jgi:hypothetical protein
MKRSINYRALFGSEDQEATAALVNELEALLAVHPAPQDYRESLRAKLLAAAGDERIYRRGITRRLVISMAVVVTLGLSVAGLIAWRNQRHLHAS